VSAIASAIAAGAIAIAPLPHFAVAVAHTAHSRVVDSGVAGMASGLFATHHMKD
jgi:hypothetical protein